MELTFPKRINKVLIISPVQEDIDEEQMTVPLESSFKQNQKYYRRKIDPYKLIFVERVLIRAFNKNLGKYLKGRQVIVFTDISNIKKEIPLKENLKLFSLKKGSKNLCFKIGDRSEENQILKGRVKEVFEEIDSKLDEELIFSSARYKTTMSKYIQ